MMRVRSGNRIKLTGTIDVPGEQLERVQQALPEHIRLTRAEPGCEIFEVTQLADCPTRFQVTEVFSDQVAFEAHQQRVKVSNWGRVTVDVIRTYRISELAHEDLS